MLACQKSHPDLVDDGIVGPATRASLARDVAAKTLPPKTGGAGGAGGDRASMLWVAIGVAAGWRSVRP